MILLKNQQYVMWNIFLIYNEVYKNNKRSVWRIYQIYYWKYLMVTKGNVVLSEMAPIQIQHLHTSPNRTHLFVLFLTWDLASLPLPLEVLKKPFFFGNVQPKMVLKSVWQERTKVEPKCSVRDRYVSCFVQTIVSIQDCSNILKLDRKQLIYKPS